MVRRTSDTVTRPSVASRGTQFKCGHSQAGLQPLLLQTLKAAIFRTFRGHDQQGASTRWRHRWRKFRLTYSEFQLDSRIGRKHECVPCLGDCFLRRLGRDGGDLGNPKAFGQQASTLQFLFCGQRDGIGFTVSFQDLTGLACRKPWQRQPVVRA